MHPDDILNVSCCFSDPAEDDASFCASLFRRGAPTTFFKAHLHSNARKGAPKIREGLNSCNRIVIAGSGCQTSARMALSTHSTMTPTSAKMASHILAMPRAPSARQISLTPIANQMFSFTIRMHLRAIRTA